MTRLRFPLERFLATITPRTKLIIVASPNNPTGTTVSREHLLENRRGGGAAGGADGG